MNEPVSLTPHPVGWRGAFQAMASPCEVLLECPDQALAGRLVQWAADEAWRIERQYSRYRTDNLVHQINTAQGAPVTVDDEMARLLDFADQCHRLSDGLFDITAGVLRRAWRFGVGATVPTQAQVAALLGLVGWHRVQWQAPVLRMPAGMEIDLGGIGKEYAVDRAMQALVACADVPMLLNFGGDLRASRPPAGQPAWRVGLEPAGAGASAIEVVSLAAGAYTTSGTTRQYIEHDGQRLGHVLDPRTGWPVRDAPLSVTVRGQTCTQTGMLSTLAMLQGREAEAFLEAQQVWFRVQR